MDANLVRTEVLSFEQYEVVEKPRTNKENFSKYDGLLRAVANLEGGNAIKLPFQKCNLSEESAKNRLTSLRTIAKRKYGYRLGGLVQNESLFLWRNPN